MTHIIGGVAGWLASILMKDQRGDGDRGQRHRRRRGSFPGVGIVNVVNVNGGGALKGALARWIVPVLGAALLIAVLRAMGVFSRFSTAR
jgi:uncharacterized membrane protein YeaQ/YmgE (transglycosylase-associated protein family)